MSKSFGLAERQFVQGVLMRSKKKGKGKTLESVCGGEDKVEELLEWVELSEKGEAPPWVYVEYKKMELRLRGLNRWCDTCGSPFRLWQGEKWSDPVLDPRGKTPYIFCSVECRDEWIEGLPFELPPFDWEGRGGRSGSRSKYDDKWWEEKGSDFPWISMCPNMDGMENVREEVDKAYQPGEGWGSLHRDGKRGKVEAKPVDSRAERLARERKEREGREAKLARIGQEKLKQLGLFAKGEVLSTEEW